MMEQSTGKYIILAGIILVMVGLIVFFFADKLQWLGKLPGDIRVERKNFAFYFPVTTMILISLLLTLIVTLIKKFL